MLSIELSEDFSKVMVSKPCESLGITEHHLKEKNIIIQKDLKEISHYRDIHIIRKDHSCSINNDIRLGVK